MAYRPTPAILERAQQLRERILACAHRRVVEGGFASLTMQALAGDAGVATGTLYRHFASKGELAAEVFSRASQVEVDVLAQALRAPGPASQRLAAGLDLFAARAWRSRQLAFALIAEPVEPEVDEQRLRYREAYASLYAQLLEDGVRRGEFRVEQIAIVAACLVGAVAEALVGPLSPSARAARDAGLPAPELSTVSQSLITFCLRAVGAKESL